jgi:hypothetical protein
VTIQNSMQVSSCCNLLAPVRQLSFNSRCARMSFSQVQRVFIVEHYLASRSCSTHQNEFKDTFPDSPVPNIRRIEQNTHRAVHFKRHCRNSLPGCIKHEEKSGCMYRWKRWTFLTFHFFVFWFPCNLFSWQIEHVSGVGCVTFDHPVCSC